MKTNGNFFILLCLLVSALSSCSKDSYSNLGEAGSFSMNIQTSNEIIGQIGETRAASEGESAEEAVVPDVNDFSVSVSAQGETVLSWDSYRVMSEEDNVELRPGVYVAKAWYGDVSEEGFGKFYFEGSQNFTVKRGENTPVTVTCYLGNAQLTIDYTDDFKDYFSESYSAEVISALGNTVEYVRDESRSAYFAPGNLSVNVSVKKPGQAQEANYEVKSFQAEPRHAYTLTLDVDVSSATMTVDFSEEVSEESVTFDVSDEALNAPAPYLVPKGFENEEVLSPVEGVSLTDDVSVFVNAVAGLASCKMTVTSTYLDGKGAAGDVDLTTSDSKLETLKGLGLEMKGLSGNVSQMALVNYTALVGNLPAGDGESAFELRAVDSYGKVSEPLTLKVSPQLCNFSVGATDAEAPFLGNTCQVAISFVDGDPSKASFTLTDGGQPLTVTGISEGMATENGKNYIVSLQAPEGVEFKNPFKVSASYLAYDMESSELPVSYGILIDNEADVWAKRAVVHVYNEDNPSGLAFQYEKDGAWQDASVKEVNGDYVTVGGLLSNSTLKLRARKTGAEPTNEVEVATEEELQVGNPGFEDWHDSFVWKGSLGLGSTDIYTFYPYRENDPDKWWSTRNDLTTVKGGYYSYYYVAYPGTTPVASSWAASEKVGLPTTACFDMNSAEIATVGWGEGSTCTTGLFGNSMNCKNHTAGALFIGSYANGQETHGHTFSSRPDKMTFYYRFRSINNESASVLMRIENREGDEVVVLAEKTLLLTPDMATTETQSETIELEYGSSNYKATHIIISFLSSTADNPSIDPYYVADNWNGNRYSRGIGNVLVIDNVSLIYE